MDIFCKDGKYFVFVMCLLSSFHHLFRMVFRSHPYGIVTDSLIAGKTNAKIHINNWQLEHLKQKMQVLAHDEYS